MKTAVVTGANQGLGFALVESLATTLPEGSDVFLTARNDERGLKATKALTDKGLNVHYHQLDVSDQTSIDAFATFLSKRNTGIDIFISNAAARISKDRSQADQAEAFINTNNHGSLAVLKAFLPLMNDNGRYLIVASSFGSLIHLPASLHHYFDTDHMSLDDVERSMEVYVDAMQDGTAQAKGWPDWINVPSKIGQVATMRVAHRLIRSLNSKDDVAISAVCPGLVDTDASRPWFDNMNHAQSPLKAAQDILWLINANDVKYDGQLVQHRRIVPWI